MERRQVFLQMVTQQVHIHTQNINLDTDTTPSTNINSKWITNLNVERKTRKLLDDNTEENLDDLGYG